MIHALAKLLNKLPKWVEAWIILGSTFGYVIVNQIRHPNSPDLGTGPVRIYDAIFVRTALWQVAMLFTLGALLRSRAWQKSDFHFAVSWEATKLGIKLWMVCHLSYIGLAFILMRIPEFQASAQNFSMSGGVSIEVVLLFSIVNPVFEEFLEIGYIFKRFEELSTASVVIISAGLRAAVHGYQGLFGVASALMFGLIAATFFARYRQLWPVVLAHGIADFVGFALSGVIR